MTPRAALLLSLPLSLLPPVLLTGCASVTRPVSDLRAPQPAGLAYGEAVRKYWTSASFEKLRASRVPLELQKVELTLYALPLAFTRPSCDPGEVLDVRVDPGDPAGRELWTLRVCDKVSEIRTVTGPDGKLPPP